METVIKKKLAFEEVYLRNQPLHLFIKKKHCRTIFPVVVVFFFYIKTVIQVVFFFYAEIVVQQNLAFEKDY